MADRSTWRQVRRPCPGRPMHGAGFLVIALAVILASAGCETTRLTTLEENSGAYADARAFLRVGRTTGEEVLAKYGRPRSVAPTDSGELWRYEQTQTVLVNAYTDTPLGTDGALLADTRGFQHAVPRKTVMEIFLNADGILRHYRLMRDAP